MQLRELQLIKKIKNESGNDYITEGPAPCMRYASCKPDKTVSARREAGANCFLTQ